MSDQFRTHDMCPYCVGGFIQRYSVGIGPKVEQTVLTSKAIPGTIDGRIETYMAEEKEAAMHPSHYNEGKIEVIDAIEDWRLGFNDGNVVKYVARHRHKTTPKQDLEKAFWYLTRELVKQHGATEMRLIEMVRTCVKDPQEGK